MSTPTFGDTSPLTSRVYVVTGAGQGLGQAVAQAAAAAGATIVLHGRVPAKLEKTYDAIVAAGGPEPAILPLDLARATADEIAGFALAIKNEFGRLDGIVHCAQHLPGLTPFHLQPMADWTEAMQVNVNAPLAMTRACLPLLRAAPDASVVFTLETHAQQLRAYWGAFAASKAALAASVQILADEWSDWSSLRINAVTPGPINTPSRRKTHPAELLESLPAASTLCPLYLHLLAGQTKDDSGTLIDAQAWLSSLDSPANG